MACELIHVALKSCNNTTVKVGREKGSSHNEEEESILLRASQIPSFDDHIRSYVASCQENDRA